MDRNSAIFDKVQEINDSFNHKYNRVTGADSMESKLMYSIYHSEQPRRKWILQ